MALSVIIFTATGVLFEGEASKVILPGEQGFFEIGSFHKPMISRLLPGMAVIDRKEYPIRHGIAKVKNNRVVLMVDSDPQAY